MASAPALGHSRSSEGALAIDVTQSDGGRYAACPRRLASFAVILLAGHHRLSRTTADGLRAYGGTNGHKRQITRRLAKSILPSHLSQKRRGACCRGECAKRLWPTANRRPIRDSLALRRHLHRCARTPRTEWDGDLLVLAQSVHGRVDGRQARRSGIAGNRNDPVDRESIDDRSRSDGDAPVCRKRIRAARSRERLCDQPAHGRSDALEWSTDPGSASSRQC
jgi:hypothetical protein